MLVGLTAYLAREMICDDDGNVLWVDEPGMARLLSPRLPWQGALELRVEGVVEPPVSLQVYVIDAAGAVHFSSGEPMLLPPIPGAFRSNFTLQNVLLPHFGDYELRIESNGQLTKSLPLCLAESESEETP